MTTIWLIEIGGEGEAAEVPPVPEPVPKRRRIRLVKLGLLLLRIALCHQKALPNSVSRPNDERTPLPPVCDHLTEDMMNES